LLNQSVKFATFADVCRMRNDTVHHRGIATKRNTGRCEVLKWAEVGEPIIVTSQRVAEFMGHFGLVSILGRSPAVSTPSEDEPPSRAPSARQCAPVSCGPQRLPAALALWSNAPNRAEKEPALEALSL
jgi:hypothetical protein